MAGGAELWGLLLLVVTSVGLAALTAVLARVGDGANVAIVVVDATQLSSVLGNDTVDVNLAGAAVSGAVTAVADDLAVVAGEEVVDVQSAAAVELVDISLISRRSTSKMPQEQQHQRHILRTRSVQLPLQRILAGVQLSLTRFTYAESYPGLRKLHRR